MSRGKKKATKRAVKKEGRLSGQYKKSIAEDIFSHFENYYPELSKVQVRRVLSYAYQSLRGGK